MMIEVFPTRPHPSGLRRSSSPMRDLFISGEMGRLEVFEGASPLPPFGLPPLSIRMERGIIVMFTMI